MDTILGIDIGVTRLRIALARRVQAAYVTEVIGARDLPSGAVIAGTVKEPELIAASIEDLVGELGIREKRCVCAVGAPAATLRVMRLPRMTTFERMRAARLEIERERGSLDGIAVRVHSAPENGTLIRRRAAKGPQLYFVGAVASHVLASRVAALRKAGLKPVAVDFEGMALCDTFPNADAVIDIGSERFSIHAISRDGALFTVWRAIGGDAVTEGIREDLAIDRTTAESRKRILGTAGAGDSAVQELVRAIAESMDVVRRRKRTLERIAIAGNGSRLHGLYDALEQSSGLSIVANRPEGLSATIFSDEVARAARTDWALAVGLACWGSRT